MDARELQQRIMNWALRVIRLVGALPRSMVSDVIGRQLVRSATSVGANYRAACRAKSRADFISKMGTVEEEADESQYWLELILAANLVKPNRIESLLEETAELVAIFTASGRTAKRNRATGRA